MRETQILRGLHKAKTQLASCNNFADGFVPDALHSYRPTVGGAVADLFGRGPQAKFNAALGQSLRGQPQAVVQTVSAPPAQPASPPAEPHGLIGGAQQGLVGGQNVMAQREAAAGLSAGTAFLEGPGTGTSDSIPANLSRGEAVLPAKTVQKVGVHNIARLIQETNGKPPTGLRAGGHYQLGGLPPNMPTADDLDLSKVKQGSMPPPGPQPKAPAGDPVRNPNVGRGAPSPEAQAWQQSRQTGSAGAAPSSTASTGAQAEQGAKTWTGKAKGAFDSLNRFGLDQGSQLPEQGAKRTPLMQRDVLDLAKSGAARTGGVLKAGVTSGFIPGAAIEAANQSYDTDTGTFSDRTGVETDGSLLKDLAVRGLGTMQNVGNAITFGLADRVGNALAGNGFGHSDSYGGSGFLGGLVDKIAGDAPRAQPKDTQPKDTQPKDTQPKDTQPKDTQPNAPSPAPLPVMDAKPQGLAGGVTRYDIPGKSPLFTNLTGEAGAKDNAALMGRGEISPQNMAAADALDAKYRAESKALGLRQEAAQRAQENGPGALLMAQIRNGLAKGGTLTRAGLAALQSLDATQRQYAATMAGHDVQRRGQDLNYDSSMYGHRTTAGLGAMQKEIQLAEIQRAMRNEALKNTNENIERSPLVMGRDKDGVAGPDKEKMARMKQFFDKNNFYSMDPAAQENAKAQFGLAEAVRNHLMNATGGVEPTPGTIKVTGVRDAELADTGKGRGLWRGVTGPLSPGDYGKSVTLNVNGVEQAVPADLFEGDNLAYVNQALEQLGYKPLSPHHLTGGK